MKKVLVLLAMMLGATNMYAQDYDLEGLAKTLKQLFPNEVNQNDEYFDFHEGLVMVKVLVGDDYKFGYLDKFGKIVIPIIYESAYDFSEGLAFVQKKGKWGFIDKNGRTVIPFIYDPSSGASFHNGIAAVKKDGKSGMIDKSGNIVVPFNWQFLDNCCDGLIFASKINNGKGEHCFINSSGEIVIPFGRFESSWGFSEGVALATTQSYYDKGKYQRGKDVVIDKTGKILFPYNSRSYIGFHEGLCTQEQGGKFGFINKTGKFVISPIYDFVGDFHEGVAFAEKGNKWGAIDKNGKTVIPFIYDGVRDCSEGLIPVNKNDEWGFVDKSNNVVIPIKYEIVSKFSDGLANVTEGGGFGYIDKQGNSTFNPPASSNTAQNTNTEAIEVTETMPSFVGGPTAMFRWLNEHLQYPEEAMNKGIKGRVIATFVVEKDGSITDIEIVKSVHPLLDNETIRVLGTMPKWIPGTQDGSPVRVKYTVPLTYNFTEE